MAIEIKHLPNLKDYGLAIAYATQAIESARLERERRELMARLQAQREASKRGRYGGGGGRHIPSPRSGILKVPTFSRSGLDPRAQALERKEQELKEMQRMQVPPEEYARRRANVFGTGRQPDIFGGGQAPLPSYTDFIQSAKRAGQQLSSGVSTIGGYLASIFG